ncbi:MAG: aminotransferase class I/II-fold pyridoxal phosphate-dependent enzyme [Bacteroidota bacterium]
MNIRTFELERVQSLYENTVPYNLTESGFHPYTLKELLSEAELEDIQNTVLGYGQTNGSIPLRQTIAQLYPNCHEEQIMVTNGTCEANFIACHTLLEKGDEVIMMVPNYMQIWGVVEEMGCQPKAFHLRSENNWAPDLDELRSLMTARTKMITICNPNNPTGYTLTETEIETIIDIAREYDCWIYADEVYRGAELNGVEGSSFMGRYEKAMVNGGLSKAYALPGLRLGWLAGPQQYVSDAWAYSDYTSITAGVLSHKIANIALQPAKRSAILQRNRSMLNENLDAVTQWAAQYNGQFDFVPPNAGGMLFVHYQYPINSTELSDWLRTEKGVFVLAGDVYGMDKYFRVGIGAEKAYLMEGLKIMGEAIEERFPSLVTQ